MQHRSEETRARILEAAHKLFSQYGYDATGVAEICEAARVSKGAFYHHFKTKQAVFLELLDEWLAGLDAAFHVVRQEAGEVPEAMIQMASMAGNVLHQADISLSIILEFWMRAYRDPVVWQACAAPYHRYQAYVASLIQEGITEGSLGAIDPEIAARVVVSMAMGLLIQALFDPRGTDWGKVTQQSMQFLMNGLARRI